GSGFERLELLADAVRECDPTRRDSEEDEIRTAAIGFEDLVRDARQGARDVSLLQHDSCRHPDLLPRLTGRNLKVVSGPFGPAPPSLPDAQRVRGMRRGREPRRSR